MIILVTGGLGFIGSHCVIELLLQNYEVIVIDNLANSKISVLDKIKNITRKNVTFYEYDMTNVQLVEEVFKNHNIDLVIHLAGLKSVKDSLSKPLLYYNHNLSITLILLSLMEKYNVKKIIFSSSSTVYGAQKSPVNENMEIGRELLNPYAKTKYMIEEILEDIYKNNVGWNIIILRYFNPCGAHRSCLLGEDPNDIPNNLMPIILKVADGIYPHLNIYGSDYDTPDGTCIRDFIHVMDLAKGHIAAIKKMNDNDTGSNQIRIYNLGTGNGYSVKQIVDTFMRVNNVKLPYIYTAGRSGDLPIIFADVSKAETELNWKSIYNLEDMCLDSWFAYKVSKKIENMNN